MKLRLALRRQSMDKIEASVRLLSSPQFQVDASSQEPRTVSQPDPAQLRGRPRLGGRDSWKTVIYVKSDRFLRCYAAVCVLPSHHAP